MVPTMLPGFVAFCEAESWAFCGEEAFSISVEPSSTFVGTDICAPAIAAQESRAMAKQPEKRPLTLKKTRIPVFVSRAFKTGTLLPHSSFGSNGKSLNCQ